VNLRTGILGLTAATLSLVAAPVGLASCARTKPLWYLSDASPKDAAVDAAVSCIDGTLVLKRATPVVMFVLDRSGSMKNSFGTTGTRWASLTNALAAALPPVDATMDIGALIFPSQDGDSASCQVPSVPDLAPAPGNVGLLMGRMETTSPGGHTPTAVALQAAALLLRGERAATSARALVLATDGAPDCNSALNPGTCTCAAGGSRCNSGILCLDDERTVDAVASLADEGLPTYVIGIQATDSDFVSTLNQMAEAGGRPQLGAAQSYYAANSEAQLEAALVTIREQVGSCTYLSSSVPDDDDLIQLTLDGVVVPHDPLGSEGWIWVNRENGELAFVGEACVRAAALAGPTVVAKVLCTRPDATTEGADGASADPGDGGSVD
jgi:hypothetical protein